MKILYVPRVDSQTVRGGDVYFAGKLGDSLRGLGVDLEFVPVDELDAHDKADAVFLTQIYQIDTAERAADWASKRGIPLVICPFYEEGLRLSYHLTLRGRGNWYRLSRAIGRRATERVFMARGARLRALDDVWHRQRCLLGAAHLLPNTRYELDHLKNWFRSPDLRATIIRLGIDREQFNIDTGQKVEHLPAPLQEWRGSYLLSAGLISARKNQMGLLKALGDLPIPIVIAGDPSPYEPDYCAEVERIARIRGSVIFTGHLIEREMAATYGHAAAHVLPSWSERPGLVSLEAAACGSRVVASTAAPVWEYLGDEVTVCAPDQPADIRRAVLEALDRPRSPEVARKVREHYTWEHTAVAFRDAVRAII